jgi:hypothetical protein
VQETKYFINYIETSSLQTNWKQSSVFFVTGVCSKPEEKKELNSSDNCKVFIMSGEFFTTKLFKSEFDCFSFDKAKLIIFFFSELTTTPKITMNKIRCRRAS